MGKRLYSKLPLLVSLLLMFSQLVPMGNAFADTGTSTTSTTAPTTSSTTSTTGSTTPTTGSTTSTTGSTTSTTGSTTSTTGSTTPTTGSTTSTTGSTTSTTSSATPAATATPADTTMLPPSNLAAKLVTPVNVQLTWSSVYGATGYKVYQISNGQMQALGQTTSTSYNINNLAQGSYSYVVSTLSGTSESGPCAPVDVNIVYPTMQAPATLTDTIKNGNDIVLNWTSSQYATSYNVYSIAADGTQTLVTSATGLTYTVTNAPAGTYSYAVSAANATYGESAISSPVQVSVVYPTMTAPTNPSYSVANGNDVTLKWSSVPYATSYKVYQIANGVKTLQSTVTTPSVTYTNQAAGDYTYEVHSYSDRFGESTDGSQIAVTVSNVTMTAPTNLAAKLQNTNTVVLTWSAVANATAYKVYQVVNGQNVLQSTVTGTSVSYSNMAGGDYTYEVHSYSDRFGESADGSQTAITVPTVTMTAPSNLTYTLQNVNDVVLSWSSVPNATSYKVYQVVNGQNVLKTTVSGTTTTFTNQAAGDYTYQVHAYSSQFGESPDGTPLDVTVGTVTMTPPNNLAYKIQNGNDIVLTWDAAQNATSYKVYQIANGQKTLKTTVTTTTATLSNMAAGDYTLEVDSSSTRFGDSQTGSQISLTLVWPTMVPPANVVQSVQSATSFSLNWDAAPNATSYKVYQIVNGQKTLKNTVSTTTVTFSNMAPGDYTYEVHSYSSRFGESADGTQLTFTLNGQTMQPPTGLTDTISNGNDITLKWTAAQYATSYKVYQVVSGQKVLQSTVTGTSVTYTNQPGGDYDYVVDSVSSLLGESPSGAEVTFTLTLPTMAAPANLAYKIQNGNDVVLTWSAVQYATSYKVYELVGGQEVLKTTVTGLSATISNVAAGDHTYVVHASSTRYGDSDGSQISFTLDQTTMAPPANLKQTITNGNDINLSWTASTYATSYNVYQIVDGQKTLKSTVTGTSVTYTNQPAGDYTFEVHSVSTRFGESTDGSQVAFTLTFPVMQAPTNLKDTIANGNDIILQWSSSTYATGYNVYQIVNGQKTLKGTVTGTSVDYINQPAGDYSYEVYSVSSRFGESPDGSTVNLSLVWPVVQPPTLKDAVANANNINFTWNAVQWATEYHLYDVTSGTPQLLYKGTALKYSVYNLSEAMHSYVVTAYNTRFGESALSNQIDENIIYPVMQPPVASVNVLSKTSATISWNFVTYANGYNIYELVNGNPVQVAKNINNLSYTLNNLTYANHQYYVTSFSNSFGESAPSNTVLAKLIIDTTPPVTTANAKSGWTNQSQVITLSATDDVTGVANTYYSLNGSPFVAGNSVTVSQEGDNKLSFYSVDNAGNQETTQTVDVQIDQTAPTTTSDASSAWSKGDVTVNLSASDAESGVANTYYSIDGSDYATGTSFTVTGEGVHKVTYYSVDNVGNTEATQETDVKIDQTAPTTTADAPSTWSKDDVTVHLNATDAASGVAATYYSIDGGTYATGTTLTVTGEGTHKVTFYSVDNAGNTEATQEVDVNIDKTAPTTTSDAPATWSKGDVTVHLSATDAQSGVANTYYSIDGSADTAGTTFTVTGDGVHKVTFYSVDNAGNTEATQEVDVKIDQTAPTTTSDAPSTWANSDVTVHLNATDALSGVVNTYYSIDGAADTAGTTLTVTGEGVHKVTFYSVDNAGNTEATQEVDVKIDQTAPTTTSNAPTTWVNHDVTVNLTAADAQSGVANTYYSIDGSAYATGTTFTVTGDGTHKVTYYSVDNAGNTETAQEVDVKIDKAGPTVTMDLQSEYKLGTVLPLNYLASDGLSGVASQQMTVTGPQPFVSKLETRGSNMYLLWPGNYTVTITATSVSGVTTTCKKQFVVYVPVDLTVTPKVLKSNSGDFTVRVDLPKGFITDGFDLNTVTLNGVKALNSNNGYYQQAKNGQFKFHSSDFTWTPNQNLEFRGYDYGILFIGETTVNTSNNGDGDDKDKNGNGYGQDGNGHDNDGKGNDSKGNDDKGWK